MNEGRKNNVLQELTNALAILLPLAQVTFIYLPDSLKGLFLQQETFLAISLVTLLMSYVSLIAYKARPWFVFVLPIHKKQMQKYTDWQSKIYQTTNEISQISNDYSQRSRVNKLRRELDKLYAKNVKEPYKINSENRVGVLLTLLFVNSLAFLIIGLSSAEGFWRTFQSLNYFFIIILSVLILVIYRDSSDNNKRYSENLRLSSDKAIQLAINANCFGLPPQVTFISTHGGAGIDNNFVRVEYKDEEYEICTNNEATKLIYCFKLSKQNVGA